MCRRHSGSSAVWLGLCSVLLATLASMGGGGVAQENSVTSPTRHFRVPRPAGLSGADALSIYENIVEEMVDGYRLSRHPVAKAYRTWRRYNLVPYRSAQHGERFVNNYANEVAKDYGQFEEAGTLPVGSVVAKDSFAVTASGDVFSGPIFLMEKMAPGFKPESRDWRYTMIMPDGSLFGTTKGKGDQRVHFCISCHAAAGEQNDHLFFVPKDLRVRFLDTELSQ